MHDNLTTLPNRVMLEQQLDLAIKQAMLNEHRFAVIWISMASKRSMTHGDITSVTGCWWQWRNGFVASSAKRCCWCVWEAMNLC